MTASIIKHADTNNFETLIDAKNKSVLVDFWAEWCGPCKVIAPVLEKFATDNQTEVDVVKINIETGENRSLASKFGVRGIPTLMLFKDGQPVATHVGSLSSAQLQIFVDKHQKKS